MKIESRYFLRVFFCAMVVFGVGARAANNGQDILDVLFEPDASGEQKAAQLMQKLSKDQVVAAAKSGATLEAMGLDFSRLPSDTVDILKNISLTGATVTQFTPPAGFTDAVKITGKAELILGISADATVVVLTPVQGSPHVAVKLIIPDIIKLSKYFPNFTAFDFLQLKNFGVMIASDDYTDNETKIPFRSGVTVFAQVGVQEGLTQVFGPASEQGAFKDMLAGIGKITDAVWLAVRLKEEKDQSKFVIYVPIKNDVPLGSALAQANTANPMPDSVVNALNKMVFKAPVMMVEIGGGTKRFILDGAVSFFNQDIQATLLYEKNKGAMLRLQLTQGWNFSQTFGEIEKSIEVPYVRPELVITNFAFQDEALGIELQPGANIVALARIADLPQSPFKDAVNKVVGTFATQLLVHVVLKKDLKDSTFYARVYSATGNDTVSLASLFGPYLAASPLKDALKLELKKPVISFEMSRKSKIMRMQGGLTFEGNTIQVNALVGQGEMPGAVAPELAPVPTIVQSAPAPAAAQPTTQSTTPTKATTRATSTTTRTTKPTTRTTSTTTRSSTTKKTGTRTTTRTQADTDSATVNADAVVARLEIALPQNWRLSTADAQKLGVSAIPLGKAAVVVSTYSFKDETRGVVIKPGVNILANVSADDVASLIGDQSLAAQFKKILSGSGYAITLDIVFAQTLSESMASLAISSANKDQNYVSLAALFADILNAPTTNFLKGPLGDIKLINPSINLSLSKASKKLLMTGGLLFGTDRVDTQVRIQSVDGSAMASLKIMLPEGWSAAKNLGEAGKSIDDMKLVQPVLILSSGIYEDEDTGVQVQSGLNVLAPFSLENLKGDFGKWIKSLKDAQQKQGQAKACPQFVIEGPFDVTLQGVVSSPTKCSFSFVLPMRIGLDFTGCNPLPLGIKKITTNGFSGTVEASVAGSVKTGLMVDIEGQSAPINFNSSVGATGTGLMVKSQMVGTIKNLFGADWLELGDIELGLTIIPPAVPTQITIAGKAILGKDPNKISFNIAADIALKNPQNIAVVGDAEKFGLTQLAALFGNIANTRVDLTAIPQLELTKAKIYFVPGESATILNKEYKQGCEGLVQANLFGEKVALYLKLGKDSFVGNGSLGKLAVRNAQGQAVFRLSRSLETEDATSTDASDVPSVSQDKMKSCCAAIGADQGEILDGPALCVNINKEKQGVCLDSRIQVVIWTGDKATYLLDQNAYVALKSTGLDASMSSRYGPFVMSAKVAADVSDFAKLDSLKNIGFTFFFDTEGFFQELTKMVSKNFMDTKAIEQRIVCLVNQCKTAQDKAKVCPANGSEIIELLSKRDQIYSQQGGVVGIAAQGIAGEFMNHLFAGAIRLEKAAVSWSVDSIIQAKLPKVSLCLNVIGVGGVSLKDMELDFMHFDTSLLHIGEELAKAFNPQMKAQSKATVNNDFCLGTRPPTKTQLQGGCPVVK